jgi:6-methylsalicylate decarboxylase
MDRLGVETAFLSISSPGVHFGDDAALAHLPGRSMKKAPAWSGNIRAGSVFSHPRRCRTCKGRLLKFVTPSSSWTQMAWSLRRTFTVSISETNGSPRCMLSSNPLPRSSSIHPTSPYCPCCSVDQQDDAAATAALGYPRPMIEFAFETTRTVTNKVVSGMLDRHPNISVIVPHAGATLPVLAGRVELLLPMLSAPGSAAPPSLRAALRKLHFDLAGAPVPELLSALLQVADPNRIHYRSDWPFILVRN